MGIIFEQNNGRYRPRLICDRCTQPIRDVRDALVIYQDPGTDNGNTWSGVFYSHKNPDCQANVRQKAGHMSDNDMWDELSTFLVMLSADVGLFPNGFQDDFDCLQAKGMVPPAP